MKEENKSRMVYLPGYEYMYDEQTKVEILGWVYDRKLGKLVEMLPEKKDTLKIIKTGQEPQIVNKEYYFAGKNVETKLDTFNIDSTEQYVYNEQTVNRFLSIDQLTRNYPELTPYQFASNTPISAIDLDGLEKFIVINKYASDGSLSSTRIYHVVDAKKVTLDVQMKNNITKEFFGNKNVLVEEDFSEAGGGQFVNSKDDFSPREKEIYEKSKTVSMKSKNDVNFSLTKDIYGTPLPKADKLLEQRKDYDKEVISYFKDILNVGDVSSFINKTDEAKSKGIREGKLSVFEIDVNFLNNSSQTKFSGSLLKELNDKYPGVKVVFGVDSSISTKVSDDNKKTGYNNNNGVTVDFKTLPND